MFYQNIYMYVLLYTVNTYQSYGTYVHLYMLYAYKVFKRLVVIYKKLQTPAIDKAISCKQAMTIRIYTLLTYMTNDTTTQSSKVLGPEHAPCNRIVKEAIQRKYEKAQKAS